MTYEQGWKSSLIFLFLFVLVLAPKFYFCFVLFCSFGHKNNFVSFCFVFWSNLKFCSVSLFVLRTSNKQEQTENKKWKIELGNFLDYANLWHTFWPGFQIVHEIFSCNCARKFRLLKFFSYTILDAFSGSFQNFKNSLLGFFYNVIRLSKFKDAHFLPDKTVVF